MSQSLQRQILQRNILAKVIREDAECCTAQDIVTGFNDGNFHIDVLAAFDLALEKVT
jgi:hypothetical protein